MPVQLHTFWRPENNHPCTWVAWVDVPQVADEPLFLSAHAFMSGEMSSNRQAEVGACSQGPEPWDYLSAASKISVCVGSVGTTRFMRRAGRPSGPGRASTDTNVRYAEQQWCRAPVLTSSSSTLTPTCAVRDGYVCCATCWELHQSCRASGL